MASSCRAGWHSRNCAECCEDVLIVAAGDSHKSRMECFNLYLRKMNNFKDSLLEALGAITSVAVAALQPPNLEGEVAAWLGQLAANPATTTNVLLDILEDEEDKAVWTAEGVSLTGRGRVHAHCLADLSTTMDFEVFVVLLEQRIDPAGDTTYWVKKTADAAGALVPVEGCEELSENQDVDEATMSKLAVDKFWSRDFEDAFERGESGDEEDEANPFIEEWCRKTALAIVYKPKSPAVST
ncbi:hypothetical protein QBC34DRAFT_429398 [Podospora aff. communis PSN243]|uniref:Uncharacterized protein n=1 Tax=Podospora aff. communis PSN243 TaxID=3040156 RepID=A0AAV9GBV5_9PEZI|nr:hypothetical protein QBC34DRAFT_429398 [Podospora aff. communis PSN243]